MKRALILTMWMAGAVAANTNLHATAIATETNVFLGQVFNVDVIVAAETAPVAPDLSAVDGFNVTTLATGQTTSAKNTWLYRYAFRATEEGDLHIPSLHFGALNTQVIGIRAQKPVVTDRMALTQELSSKTVFVGEPILLKTTWDSTYQFGAIKAVDFYFPILNDKRFQIMERYAPNKENAANATGLPVHGTRVLASRRSYDVEGTQHQSLEFEKLLIPKKSGRLEIAPATLLCAADKEREVNNKTRRSAFQYPAYFDNTFFDQNVGGDQWTRVYTESAPLDIEVKPLPTAGRPDLFNGMVGEFTIAVSAEPLDVRVGEPITLTISVTAARFLENILFPPLRYQPYLVNQFEVPSDRSLPTRRGTTKTYTQTIRPLSTSNHEIPPIQLAFFSPASNAYVTIQSDAIPLSVSPAEEMGVFGGAAYQTRLRTIEDGIRHNREDARVLRNRRAPLLGWTHPALALGLILLPPLLMGGLSLAELFGEKKQVIHRTAKAARAFKVFRRNAAHIHAHTMKTEIYRDLDNVLRAYLGDRLQLVPGALSYRDAETRLLHAGADPQTLVDLKALFALCEAYRFTTQYDEPGDARGIVAEAIRVIRAVERKLK